MEFKTDRLWVRPFSPADEAALIALMKDPVVGRTYMVPDLPDIEAERAFFRRLQALSLDTSRFISGIYLDTLLIGMVNETEICGDSIELGYALAPQYHNRGFATEMLRGAIAYLFAAGFSQVLCGAFETNAASIRVMVKSGMTHLPQADTIFYRNQEHRCVYYGIQKA